MPVLAGGAYLLLPVAGPVGKASAAMTDGDTLRAQSKGRPWSRKSGGQVDRYEVRSGDHMDGDGPQKERSEAYSAQKLAAGQLYEISFALMIEPGPRNTAPWMTLVQLQSTFDKGESGHSPPFALEMIGERMRIVSRTDPNRISGPNDFTFTRQYLDPSDIQRGKWYAFRIRVKFDPFGRGVLSVWRDGKQLVDYHGAIGFDDVAGAYFKEGVYRGSSAEPYAVNFRGLTIQAVDR